MRRHGRFPVSGWLRGRLRRERTGEMGRLDAGRIRAFRRGLLRWYRRKGRELPWRGTADPYAILVSETMLQQTQVARVQEYYARFLRRYPTFEALASASEPEVRESWEGLGYYARARNLHATARTVVGEYAGRLPADAAAMQRLPGIGRYTAGAVLSFAFGRRAAILDTNAARVLSRVFGVRPGPSRSRLHARLWRIAECVTPARTAPIYNQAIMDLGATICTARAPSCRACPVRPGCKSGAAGAAVIAGAHAATVTRRADRESAGSRPRRPAPGIERRGRRLSPRRRSTRGGTGGSDRRRSPTAS